MGIFDKLSVIKKKNNVLEVNEKSMQTDGILYIAEILYETGELHYRYSRKLSEDGATWIRDGLFEEYYQNGNLASEGLYNDGYEEGYWKDYYENGNIAAEGYYSKGKEIGKWKYYDEQGKIEEEEYN